MYPCMSLESDNDRIFAALSVNGALAKKEVEKYIRINHNFGHDLPVFIG